MTKIFKDEESLIPAIIQDISTKKVLMLGYMNKAALEKTERDGFVTFYSRSKERLWTKGETSGNKLKYVSFEIDCDKDTLLIKAEPFGPVCHSGSDTCFNEINTHQDNFLEILQAMIKHRKSNPIAGSYTCQLFSGGLSRIAQKVGEEAVEVVIASLEKEKSKIISESADLIYHFIVLLTESEVNLEDIIDELRKRNKDS